MATARAAVAATAVREARRAVRRILRELRALNATAPDFRLRDTNMPPLRPQAGCSLTITKREKSVRFVRMQPTITIILARSATDMGGSRNRQAYIVLHAAMV